MLLHVVLLIDIITKVECLAAMKSGIDGGVLWAKGEAMDLTWRGEERSYKAGDSGAMLSHARHAATLGTQCSQSAPGEGTAPFP